MCTDPSDNRISTFESVSTSYSGKIILRQQEDKTGQVQTEDKHSFRVEDT